MTEAKSRYGRYLHADSGRTFAEWLGIDVPRLECDHSFLSGDRFRYKSSRATGAWKRSRKDAKASYKAALHAPQQNNTP